MKTGFLRVLAAAIDVAAGAALCFVLSSSTGLYFSHRAVAAFAIGSPDTIWQGPIPMLISIHGRLFYGFPFALLLVLLTEPVSGVGLGKFFTRLCVASTKSGPVATEQLWKRAAVKTSGLWLMVVALAAGRWELVILAALASLVTILGTLPALVPGGRTLHDRLSQTRVVSAAERSPWPGHANHR